MRMRLLFCSVPHDIVRVFDIESRVNILEYLRSIAYMSKRCALGIMESLTVNERQLDTELVQESR